MTTVSMTICDVEQQVKERIVALAIQLNITVAKLLTVLMDV